MEPYWGPVTSSIDFCEPNYVWTPYVAEFWNSLTSLFIAYVGVVAYLMAPEYMFTTHSLFLRACYGSLVVIGLGSAAFHGTLLREYQAWDEIPMMLGSIVSVCGMREFLHSRDVKHSARAAITRRERILALLAMATQIWLYFYRGDFATFFAIFICLLLYVVYLVVRILKVLNDPALNQICVRSATIFICAAVVWLLSECFCEQFGFLHPHVLWHFGSAIGAGHHILFHCFILNLEKARKLKLQWRYGVPVLAAAEHTD
eukprot:GEMP01037500.1.p1 GENE.GEMP01037500.1~~GEMP01037500.1.p1  ORF type:complete len:259 (+),score=42.44 GEMP01037500.1:173-949(+)